MGIFQNNLMGAAAAAASAGGGGFYDYQIANSIRGSAAGDTTLKFTAGTPTSTTKMTMSFWVKRHTPDSTNAGANNVFTTGTGGGNYFYIAYNATLTMENSGGNQGTGYLLTEEKYRDPASWYHVILRIDTSQSTQFDRIRVYVNGRQLGTSPSATWRNQAMITNTAQNETFSYLNADGLVQAWGGLSGKGHGTEGADLSLADCMFFDGQSYYSELGEYKNGVWIPKDPSGLTFGNNGYWLKFESSSDLGNDSSGNNNDFTVANFAAHDQLTDTPTFNSDSNGGNYCTLNPLFPDPTVARINDGMLAWGGSGGGGSVNEMGCMSTFAISPSDTNKYYFEARMKTGHSGGIEQSVGVNVPTADLTSDRGGRPTAWCITNSDNQRIYNGANSYTNTGVAGSAGDIVGVEIDRANTTIKFYVNGTLRGTQTNLNTTTDLYPWVGTGGSTSDALGWDMNFGQNGTFNGLATAQGESDATGYGNFYYDEANSCKALCAGNLPVAAEVDPAQTDDDYPQKLHNPIIWTGNGGTLNVTGLGYQPDLVWYKRRDSASSHILMDSTRGTSKAIESNNNGSQDTSFTSGITAFGADGFTLGNQSQGNASGGTYVGWSWRANGGSTSSGSGDLTSTYQVDPSGGFSIVTAVGDGGSGDKTVTHGMSAAPDCILSKNLDTSYNWDTYWSSGTTSGYGLRLNTTDAQLSGRWGTVNSSIFTCKHNYTWYSTNNYIYYCFRNIEGYIKVGNYNGNGESSNGTFVYTGFRPAFVMGKGVVSGAAWWIQDNATSPYNESIGVQEPNDSSAMYTSANPNVDFLSNGFKVRNNNAMFNSTSYDPYVFLAVAHNPFKYATAR